MKKSNGKRRKEEEEEDETVSFNSPEMFFRGGGGGMGGLKADDSRSCRVPRAVCVTGLRLADGIFSILKLPESRREEPSSGCGSRR